MSKFQQDAEKLLAAVGGKENIQAITHCVTRLRFVLVDPQKADVARINVDAARRDLPSVYHHYRAFIAAKMMMRDSWLSPISTATPPSRRCRKTSARTWAITNCCSATIATLRPLPPKCRCTLTKRRSGIAAKPDAYAKIKAAG